MWFILQFIGFTVFLSGTYGNQDLRITAESLNISYINTNFGEFFAKLVPISKLTNQIRATIRFYFEPTEKLMVAATIYKLGSNNKAYRFSHISRSLKAFMLFAESAPLGQAIGPHITPNFYWPPQANVTYTLHDYWFPKSKLSVIDIPIPTGRYTALVDGKYTNKTVLIKAEAVVKIFYSGEDFD